MSGTVSQEKLDKAFSLICRNPLKERMEAGLLSYSFGLRICFDPQMALMAKQAGYHAMIMSLEHSQQGLQSAAAVCAACLNVGITPILIVPSLQLDWISRGLDVGAQGIVVPRLSTADQAREFVKYAKYRPIGERAFVATPHFQFQTADTDASKAAGNATTLAICLIETVEAIKNIEEIAAVPGIDSFLIGAFDLSDDMGIAAQYDNPKLWEAIDTVCAAGLKHGIHIAIGGMEKRQDLLQKLCKEYKNVRYIMAGRDVNFLFASMQDQCKTLKALGDSLQ